METASETSSRCGTLPGSKNDARDRVNANSHPRCLLPLHSNCWAEISTLAASELAQKKRSRIAGLPRSSTRLFRGSLPHSEPRPKRQVAPGVKGNELSRSIIQALTGLPGDPPV